jgi:hypothetical protein
MRRTVAACRAFSLGLAAAGAPAGPGGLEVFADALDDQLALELVDRAEEAEDQAPGRRGGVDVLRVCRCDSRLPCAMPRYPAAPEIGPLACAFRGGSGLPIVVQKMGASASPYDLHTVCTRSSSARCLYE